MKTSETGILEHDIVVLTQDYQGLKSGAKGTVVHVYNYNTFEVEFINTDGKHLVETVCLNKINKL